jgi:hypothetical protein
MLHAGVVMKTYLLAVVALTCILGGSAFAADLPVKAKPIVCVACNWNGFYVGVNFGGAIGHNASQDAVSLNPPGNFGGAVAPGVGNPISATSYAQSPVGALGGGQIGFNWQTGHLVLGAEADWDWTNQRSSLQVNNYIASGSFIAPANYTLTDQQKIDWLATLRAPRLEHRLLALVRHRRCSVGRCENNVDVPGDRQHRICLSSWIGSFQRHQDRLDRRRWRRDLVGLDGRQPLVGQA